MPHKMTPDEIRAFLTHGTRTAKVAQASAMDERSYGALHELTTLYDADLCEATERGERPRSTSRPATGGWGRSLAKQRCPVV